MLVCYIRDVLEMSWIISQIKPQCCLGITYLYPVVVYQLNIRFYCSNSIVSIWNPNAMCSSGEPTNICNFVMMTCRLTHLVSCHWFYFEICFSSDVNIVCLLSFMECSVDVDAGIFIFIISRSYFIHLCILFRLWCKDSSYFYSWDLRRNSQQSDSWDIRTEESSQFSHHNIHWSYHWVCTSQHGNRSNWLVSFYPSISETFSYPF